MMGRSVPAMRGSTETPQRRFGSHRMQPVLHGRLQSTRNCWLGQPDFGVVEPCVGEFERTVLRRAAGW